MIGSRQLRSACAGVCTPIRTIAALPLFPGILDKFLTESFFRQLPIALYGYEAFGCIQPARQGQSQSDPIFGVAITPKSLGASGGRSRPR
jgi:hypothetical protein